MNNEVNQKHNTLFIIIASVLAVIVLAVAGFLIYSRFAKKTEITVLVAPTTAKIEINGKEYKNGTSEIAPGTYTVKISADGFESKELELVAKSDEIALLYEYLTPTTGKYSLADYDLLPYISKDEKTDELIYARKKAESLFDLLPLENSDLGLIISDASANCDASSLCLKISSYLSASKEEALNFLRESGFDPEAFEISFERETED
ncbi:hypothetical protein IJI70_00835 [Candidatus Saccharibacteria bacterium]|nr:hypothetical protein [Candidatus Saccharibacteria bacterium]